MDYIEAVNDFEDNFYSIVPEILPEDRLHDGWDGAAGVEIRSDPWYEPYPHNWDESLNWCRIRWAIHTQQYNEMDLSRPANKIPGWVYRRALWAFKGMKY